MKQEVLKYMNYHQPVNPSDETAGLNERHLSRESPGRRLKVDRPKRLLPCLLSSQLPGLII